jgi:putative Mg2+ transporter-C (MgtC) family protein
MLSALFETETPILQLTLRLCLALVLGGMIGIEREIKKRPAGLRTNMMVSLAAALFTLLAMELISDSREAGDIMRVDPLRTIEAVIAGVAFLGAGAIIRGGDGDNVKGLTTGASLWVAGAIGVACGGGYHAIAAIATILAVIVLYVIGVIEQRLSKSD